MKLSFVVFGEVVYRASKVSVSVCVFISGEEKTGRTLSKWCWTSSQNSLWLRAAHVLPSPSVYLTLSCGWCGPDDCSSFHTCRVCRVCRAMIPPHRTRASVFCVQSCDRTLSCFQEVMVSFIRSSSYISICFLFDSSVFLNLFQRFSCHNMEMLFISLKDMNIEMILKLSRNELLM